MTYFRPPKGEYSERTLKNTEATMKVDVTKIEGYADMTPEEKLKALEGYEFEDPDMSEFVSKKTFDKTASELAKKKKELADKLTEDEARQLADKENLEAMQKELAELRRERQIAENKAKYLGLGYSEELAADTAKALSDGDMDKVFKNQKAHLESTCNYSVALVALRLSGISVRQAVCTCYIPSRQQP